MKKELDYMIINYGKKDLSYIEELINFIDEKSQEIVNFFDLTEFGSKVEVTIHDDINKFRDYVKKIQNKDSIPNWLCGLSHSVVNGKYTDSRYIEILSLEEYKKTSCHENDTLEDLKYLILHEFTHACHQKYNHNQSVYLWLSEGAATTISHQFDNQHLMFNTSLEQMKSGPSNYNNFHTMFYYVYNVYGREYILSLFKNNELLKIETPRLYQETKEYINKIKLQKYFNQDKNNPKYFFHGSPLKLNKLEIKQSHDNNNIEANIDTAIFLTPSIIIASSYAFKDTIKNNSSDLNWNFEVKSTEEIPVMSMNNVRIDEEIIGYIYVFENDGTFINSPINSMQYKTYKELIPIDILTIQYKAFKQYYQDNTKIKISKVL
jgi:hypothetical protein